MFKRSLSRIIAAGAMTATLASPAVLAHHEWGGYGHPPPPSHHYGPYGHSGPAYHHAPQQQACWHEPAPYHGPRSFTPEIVGGLVGAAVGNRFGRGSGRRIATGAGALLGGSIAHDYKNFAYAGRAGTVVRCGPRY